MENINEISSETLVMEDIPKSPFRLKIETTEEGEKYSLILGEFTIKEKMNSREDVQRYLEENKWEIITAMITIASNYAVSLLTKKD